jgi:hypothetical protein
MVEQAMSILKMIKLKRSSLIVEALK